MGALTSKTYAYKARPWEIQSKETVSILDPFFQPIKLDMRDYKIMRILPLVGHEEWIHDNIRFPVIKKKNRHNYINLLHHPKYHKIENNTISSRFTYQQIASTWEVISSIQRKAANSKKLTITLGTKDDAQTIAAARQLQTLRFKNVDFNLCSLIHRDSYTSTKTHLNAILGASTIIIPRQSNVEMLLLQKLIHTSSVTLPSLQYIDLQTALNFIEGKIQYENIHLLTDAAYEKLIPQRIPRLVIDTPNQAYAIANASSPLTRYHAQNNILIAHQDMQIVLVTNKSVAITINIPSQILTKNRYVDIFGRQKATQQLENATPVVKDFIKGILVQH